MPTCELETIPDLRRRLAADPDLAEVVLQNLDLRGMAAELAPARFHRAVLLGCVMDRDLYLRVMEEGALVFPRIDSIPYEPYRARLYEPDELVSGFSADAPDGYDRTFDGRVYRHFLATGAGKPTDVLEALARRIHDHAMCDAMREFLAGKRSVAVMGGHRMRRDDPVYRDVAVLSRTLTEEGFLMVSGGGPGAMEATHLGAWLAWQGDDALDGAIAILSACPIYSPKEHWLATSIAARDRYPRIEHGGALPDSLGIPTWLYGHEPPSVFASRIAKYFENSIREDGLVSVADHGIIFSPGMAGTVQEIFQTATLNHYVELPETTPMILLGRGYWSERLPAAALLEALSRGRPYAARLASVDTGAEALAIVRAFASEKAARAAAKG